MQKGPAVSIQFPDPIGSRSLRRSLKRGLARQTMQHARTTDADSDKIFAALREMKPNRVAMERLVHRLRRLPGVVRAGIGAEGRGVVIVLRNVCETVIRTEAADLFSECALLFTRVCAVAQRDSVQFGINRATFCLHALERLVERSQSPLDPSFLAAVDAEAVVLLRAGASSARIEHDGNSYIRAAATGVWAGSFDETPPEPEWGASVIPSVGVPTFSARTFLSPNEMKPAVWLRWQPDPTLSAA